MKEDVDLYGERKVRLVACGAIGLSLMSVLLCMALFPVLNNDVSTLEHELQEYMDDFKVKNHLIFLVELKSDGFVRHSPTTSGGISWACVHSTTGSSVKAATACRLRPNREDPTAPTHLQPDHQAALEADRVAIRAVLVETMDHRKEDLMDLVSQFKVAETKAAVMGAVVVVVNRKDLHPKLQRDQHHTDHQQLLHRRQNTSAVSNYRLSLQNSEILTFDGFRLRPTATKQMPGRTSRSTW